MWGVAVLVGAIVIAVLACLAPRVWRPVTQQRIQRFARRQSLVVTVAGEPLLVGYLAITRRWRTGGLLVSLVASVALPVLAAHLGPGGVPPGVDIHFSFIGLFAGWFAGAVVAEWLVSTGPTGTQRRALLQPRRVADYLARPARTVAVAMWLLLAATDLAGLVYVAIVHPGGLVPIALWVVVDVVVAGVLVMVAKRIVTRPQRGESPGVIETDDAIRSRSLHVMAGSALTIGGYLLTATVQALAPFSVVLADGIAPALGLLCGLAIPVLGYVIATTTSGPVRRGYDAMSGSSGSGQQS